MFGKDHHTDDSFNIRTMLTFCMLAFICGCNTPGAPESIMTPAVKMPEWLYRVESEHLNKSMTDEEKMRFVISLALENVDRGTGGPFGAAIFEIATGKLVAAGVNSVVPANQSWAHAEMTAFARAHRCVLVLKGHRTITAFPDGTAYINTTGNPGMAKGGSGDVLAGVILSLLGQGLPARQAVPMAVWLHGAAGDRCAREIGEYGMTPADLAEALPAVIREHVK